MRVFDKPLPGDLVIRARQEHSHLKRTVDVFVVTHWPDAERVVAGPYQSYSYALQQARRLLKDRSEVIWFDHARLGEAERLEQVGSGTERQN
jgi:hypothetical protein